MTVPSWNAEAWHRQHRRSEAPTPPKRGPNWITIGIVAVILGAAAVSATSGVLRDEQIGICHATGSQSQPFVYLAADKNGYEHGHHRHHAGDYFLADVGDCSGLPAPADEGLDGLPDGNATEEPADAEDTGYDVEPGDEAEAGDTLPDDVPADGNASDAPAEGNETEPEPTPEEPADDNGTQNATSPDLMVRQTSVQDDFEVVLTLVVRNIGDGVAGDASLVDALPDVRRTWYVGGEDASDCVLDGRDLSCWFGALSPGESRSITLRAYTDRMPCGFSLTNTAYASAVDDAESRNDASSASIAARAC